MKSNPSRIAERYRLDARLGEGAHGVVWRGWDDVTNRPVAVKILRPGRLRDRASLRREVAAMRIARTPGIVELVDEGTYLGRPFIVMALIDGSPFPGRVGPMQWADLAPIAARLLTILEHVHSVGVIHCDLKPANALVAGNGSVTLLDFGIARVGSLSAVATDAWIGTPRYAAPEVLLGDDPSVASDLYSVGVMLEEALVGPSTNDRTDLSRLLRDKLLRCAHTTPLAEARVPEAVYRAISLLVEPRPESRPPSARVASAMLGDFVESGLDSVVFPMLAGADHVSEEELRTIFVGLDRVFHIPEDAARILYHSTRGNPKRVMEELGRWERAGFVEVVREGLRISREALDAVRCNGMRLAKRWSDRTRSTRDLVEDATREARTLHEDGATSDALAVLVEAARLCEARQVELGPPISETLLIGVFALWAEIVCQERQPQQLDRLTYELAKTGDHWPQLRAISELVHAALDLDQDPIRALDRLEALPTFEDEALERTRASIIMVAARSASVAREQDLFDCIESWAVGRSPLTRARVLGFRGRLEYRLNRFDDAAESHLACAQSVELAVDRAAALLNSASACCEAMRFDEAITRAQLAIAALGGQRHPLLELRAEWVRRWARYRRGDPIGPDHELVSVAEAIGIPAMLAPVLLLEAAVEWRERNFPKARRLAGSAAETWEAIRALPDLRLLCRALAAASAPANTVVLEHLTTAASQCATFGIEIQILGLVASLEPLHERSAERARALFLELDGAARNVRLDVISPAEAMTFVESWKHPFTTVPPNRLR